MFADFLTEDGNRPFDLTVTGKRIKETIVGRSRALSRRRQ
jgi:hypothetical protein